jgi:hypothetical protein
MPATTTLSLSFTTQEATVADLTPTVGVVRWTESDTPDAAEDPDRMEPASPRHARPGGGAWKRTVVAGQEALTSSAEAIAVEVDRVAERIMIALEQRQTDRQEARVQAQQPDPAWNIDQVEVTFGIQLTGETSLAVFSTTAESSAQIALTFSRDARP